MVCRSEAGVFIVINQDRDALDIARDCIDKSR
jgi:hypothetical protein